MPGDNEIDVAFGIDANFVPHAAAVIASVVHYAPQARFRFIVLHTDVDEETRARVETIAPQSRFEWIEVGDNDVPPFASRMHFTRATLFRMGLEKLAPADCHRAIYLDADITLLADVRKLWTTDLEGAPIGAVHDPNVDAAEFAERWSLDKTGDYFNAGILLVDLDRVRAEKLFTKAVAFLAEHAHNLPWNDQDALNWACWGRWRKLDSVWNVQRAMAISDSAAKLPPEQRIDGRRPAIIHFTGREKPWIANAYHPWSWVYWQSLTRTPFAAEVAARQGVGSKERLKLLARWLRRWPWAGRAI